MEHNGLPQQDDIKNRLLLTFSGFYKEALDYGGPKYNVASGSIEYSYPLWSSLFRVGASLDYMCDQSHGAILERNNVAYKSDWELAKLGVAANAEIILDRLSLILHFGGYYHNLSRDIRNQWVYQRVGLRYQLTPSLWAHLALKTHWNLADYIELGLAVKVFP